ncbi:DUF504 domain-containing protein [Methanocaldococcus sp.]
MLKEIINKILWHPKYKKEDYEIVILHRGSKDNKKVIPMEDIEVKGNFLVYYNTLIPLHRILEIRDKNNKKVIYKKA